MDGIPDTLSERNKELMYKYWAGELTTEDEQELAEACRQDPDLIYIKQLLDDKQFVNEYIENLEKAETNLENNRSKAWARIEAQTPPAKKVIRLIPWQRLMIAGVLLPLIIAAAWLFSRHDKQQQQLTVINNSATGGGSNRATLSLAVGLRFILNEMANGKIWTNGVNTILKEDSSLHLIVDTAAARQLIDNPSITQYDTLETPRGGQFGIILPDGSHIRLNAESKLIFPTAFTGGHREARIIGEGFFEIKSNSRQPFIVQLPNKDSVEVLGTSFNISAYTDDSLIQTTLITGNVLIRNGKRNKYLSPNDQLIIRNNGAWQLRKDVDAEASIAWTSNEFNFNGDSLSHALRQIARWYDRELIPDPAIKEATLHGSQSRQKQLRILLNAISSNGIDTFFHFKLEDRKIFVSQ